MTWSLKSRCYPQQQAAAERSMSRMVTQLHSDVASRPTHNRRAARLSVARLQSAGAGSGLDIKGRTSLRGYVLVGCCGSSSSSSSSSQSLVSQHRIPRQVESSALGTSLRRQTRGSKRGLGRLDPTRSAAPQRVSTRHQTTTAVTRRLLESLHAQLNLFRSHM